jgi:hypothetical protein
VRYHYTFTVNKILKMTKASAVKDKEKLKLSHVPAGKANDAIPLEKRLEYP